MPMSLKDFVRDTLAGIVNAVEEAQKDVGAEKAALIAPQVIFIGQGSNIHESDVKVIYPGEEHDDPVAVKANLVRFDLAVHAGDTVEVAAEAMASANLGLFAKIKASVAGKGITEDKRISRIQFEIPVIPSLPTRTLPVGQETLPVDTPSKGT